MSDHSENEKIVREFFAAYQSGDQAAAEKLVTDDFVYTSTQHDHIDRATFFEVCFPTASKLKEYTLVHVVGATDDSMFALYEYVLTSGERRRNCEFVVVRGGQVAESQAYLGGRFDK